MPEFIQYECRKFSGGCGKTFKVIRENCPACGAMLLRVTHFIAPSNKVRLDAHIAQNPSSTFLDGLAEVILPPQTGLSGPEGWLLDNERLAKKLKIS